MGSRASIQAALERRVEQAVARVGVNVTHELVATTPVDTGWARANWIPSVGRANRETVGSPKSPSHSRQAAGLAEIIRFKLEDGEAHVTNVVPYIRRLDAGSSKQAPAGFVRAGVARGVEASRL